jgi:glycerol transport system substrate-binding protein
VGRGSSTRSEAQFWFDKSKKDGNIAPQPKLADEKPKGEAVNYDTLIKSWPVSAKPQLS